MTVRELSQLYYLRREIELDKARLRALREGAEIGAAAMTGMPKKGGKSDLVGNAAAEIADLEALIEAKIVQCVYERRRLERYIAAIPDSITRQVFTLRFVEGRSWNQVARILGGGNTGDSCRKIVNRFLQKN